MQAGRECIPGQDSWENWGGSNIGGEGWAGRRLKWHNPHVTWWGVRGGDTGWALSMWQGNST